MPTCCLDTWQSMRRPHRWDNLAMALTNSLEKYPKSAFLTDSHCGTSRLPDLNSLDCLHHLMQSRMLVHMHPNFISHMSWQGPIITNAHAASLGSPPAMATLAHADITKMLDTVLPKPQLNLLLNVTETFNFQQYEVCSKSIRLFSLSNSVQPNHSCKSWAHTHTFMRNCEKFPADCASHSFSVNCLLRSQNTSLAILYFQENFIVMMEQIGQRYCIKFCQKLGDTQIETIRKIQQVFGNVALSPTQTKEWFKCFRNGRESVESEPRSGRPCTSRNEDVKDQVHEEVLNDRCVTVREIAVEVGISTGSVHSILTEDL